MSMMIAMMTVMTRGCHDDDDCNDDCHDQRVILKEQHESIDWEHLMMV